jgi:hypothetical protein
MSRPLTKIEQDALAMRLKMRAKEVVLERLKGKGLPLVTDMEIWTPNGVPLSIKQKSELVERLLLDGMVQGLQVFNAFREEIKSFERELEPQTIEHLYWCD